MCFLVTNKGSCMNHYHVTYQLNESVHKIKNMSHNSCSNNLFFNVCSKLKNVSACRTRSTVTLLDLEDLREHPFFF